MLCAQKLEVAKKKKKKASEPSLSFKVLSCKRLLPDFKSQTCNILS
jgi:hypothetical protein